MYILKQSSQYFHQNNEICKCDDFYKLCTLKVYILVRKVFFVFFNDVNVNICWFLTTSLWCWFLKFLELLF
jgi:hypothetical protein